MNAAPSSPHDQRHPVRVVTRRTGLNADLLRAWERRYGAVTPTRSAGGQRLYSEEDVERLLLLRHLTEYGHPIGQVARLETTLLREMLLTHGISEGGAPVAVPGPAVPDDQVTAGLRLVDRLDGQGLEGLLRRSAQQHGIAPVIEGLVTPLMHELGERWHRGELNPAHEHLASGVIERTLHWMLDGSEQPAGAPRIALATLQGERHEVGIQVAAAVAAAEGWSPIYLGADLPADAIVEATQQSGARVLALSVAIPSPELGEVLTTLRAGLPSRVAVVVGGSGLRGVARSLPAGVTALADLPALRAFLYSYRIAKSA